MKRWQYPAARLPFRIRPVRGETLVSFIFRLADANALARPTLLLRALGEPRGALPTASWINAYEITLNTAAAHRLETFTGVPIARLRTALPALVTTSTGPDPNTPTFHGHRSVRLRDHCQECVARLPGHPRIRVHDKLPPRSADNTADGSEPHTPDPPDRPVRHPGPPQGPPPPQAAMFRPPVTGTGRWNNSQPPNTLHTNGSDTAPTPNTGTCTHVGTSEPPQ
ncbi:TniQ family protein [Nocardia arizonensis]|uniref:TniQ family protein n=1 Tax=Nocardia arizonensis TaxID=1141647 RepID=UPI000B1BF2C6